MNESRYFFRALIATVSAWVTLAFYNFSVRDLTRIDVELAVTIVVVSLGVSFISGFAVAALIRKRPIAMVVISQLLSALMLACLSFFSGMGH